MNQTLLIDFDSTLITKETLDVLAAITLIGDPESDQKVAEIKRITDAGMNGEITFEESLRSRLEAFTPHRIHMLQTMQYLSSSVSPSFLKHRDDIANHAENVFIISGGFREIILPIAERFGIDSSHVFANEFYFDEKGAYLGINTANPLSRDGGKVTIATMLKNEGFFTESVNAIGDGSTDLELKKAGIADTFFAYTETVARDSVIAKADHIAPSFTDIASHLGWQLSLIEHNGMRGEINTTPMQMRK